MALALAVALALARCWPANPSRVEPALRHVHPRRRSYPSSYRNLNPLVVRGH